MSKSPERKARTLRSAAASGLLALLTCSAASTYADDLQKVREKVQNALPGGYIHSHIRGQGGCSIAPLKDKPGWFTLLGEGTSGKGVFRLDDENPYHLIKVSGAHPGRATVCITSGGVEVVWHCPENHGWISPR